MDSDAVDLIWFSGATTDFHFASGILKYKIKGEALAHSDEYDRNVLTFFTSF